MIHKKRSFILLLDFSCCSLASNSLNTCTLHQPLHPRTPFATISLCSQFSTLTFLTFQNGFPLLLTLGAPLLQNQVERTITLLCFFIPPLALFSHSHLLCLPLFLSHLVSHSLYVYKPDSLSLLSDMPFYL